MQEESIRPTGSPHALGFRVLWPRPPPPRASAPPDSALDPQGEASTASPPAVGPLSSPPPLSPQGVARPTATSASGGGCWALGGGTGPGGGLGPALLPPAGSHQLQVPHNWHPCGEHVCVCVCRGGEGTCPSAGGPCAGHLPWPGGPGLILHVLTPPQCQGSCFMAAGPVPWMSASSYGCWFHPAGFDLIL